MNKIKIGWSEKKLIPDGVKVSLAGQFYERVTNVVETPITVTCVAFDNGDDCALMCSCDLESVGYDLLVKVRENIAKKSSLPVEKVIISAVHVHTGPDFNGRDLSASATGGLQVLKKFMPPHIKYEQLEETSQTDIFCGDEACEYIANVIADTAIEAWETRKEGFFASAFGRAAVGMCRRVCYDDGSAKMWGDTDMANFTELESGNDSGIELLFTYDQSKKLTGVIANVACPAQILEHRTFISSDYWGKVKENLRKEYGESLFVLGLISAAGDQCPRDMIRWVEPETPINDPNIIRENVTIRVADPSMFDLKGCKLAARRISDEIKYALADVDTFTDKAPLIHKNIKLDMPLRRVTIEEKDKAVKEVADFFEKIDGSFNFRDSARLHVHAGTIVRYELQQIQETDEIEVHFIRLGNIAFATNPYELFLNYGNQIRARSKASQTFLIQLCCGSRGYLPTEKAEKGQHYSAYVSSGKTGHMGGELLVRKTLSEINEMFK